MQRRTKHLPAVVLLFCLCIAQTSCRPKELSDAIADSSLVRDIMRTAKAAEMRNYMNESVDPCKNFYKFACGNWARINPANSMEHLTTGFFEVMSKAFNRKVVSILEASADDADTPTDSKVKDFYESCTKMDKIREKLKTEPYEIIAEFGEMPALEGEKWNEERFDWLETVARIAQKYGKQIIIGLDVLPDYADNSVNRVYIGHPDFPLESRSMYLDRVTGIYRDGYRSKIASELRKFLGMKSQLAAKTAKEILDFEISLATGMVDEKLGLGLDEMSVESTVELMQRKYAPTIDIKRLVNITLGEMIDGKVYEFVERYQVNLMDVIEETPKSVVANYIFYNLLDEFIMKLGKTQAAHNKICIDKTKKYFADVLDNMIYRKYNTRDTERDVNLIWNELKETFRSMLTSTSRYSWIQWPTRKYAIEKLDAMKLDINSYANENFTEDFAELNISKDDFIENIKNILKLSTLQSLAELHEPPKPLEAGELLSYTPANIILENKIKVPVSLLQPYHLWAKNYPNALKFGTLGSLVAHELIHGFDDDGRKFDKHGNNIDWWDGDSTDAFDQRTECFTKQYAQYIYGGHFLPRSASQSENIADNGGVRLAYTAYLKWYNDSKQAGLKMDMETLPKLNYTSKQLFFISYAQVWCNDAHPQIRDLQTSTDLHVPGMFRVIGPLSNFNAFAEEFNCAVGTYMNPRKKCQIY